MENTITNPINQVQKFDKLKDTYGFVKTDDILQAFYEKGWVEKTTKIANVLNLERQGFQKHLIRLEHPDFPEIPGLTQDNKSVPQLCLLNSHDGTSSLQMFLGLIRMACLNGIIAGNSLSYIRLNHSKHIMNRVPDAIDFMSNSIPRMIEQIQLLSGRQFSEETLRQFVCKCVDARLKNVNNIVHVDYNSALDIIRPEDQESDAFTVMNRIQEKVIRGGINYSYNRNYKDKNGEVIETRLTHTRTRALRSVVGQVRLNRLVYDNAFKLAA